MREQKLEKEEIGVVVGEGVLWEGVVKEDYVDVQITAVNHTSVQAAQIH